MKSPNSTSHSFVALCTLATLSLLAILPLTAVAQETPAKPADDDGASRRVLTSKYLGAEGTPLVAVPSSRWGDLEAGPMLIDSTAVENEPGDRPFPHQVTTAGDYLFFATGQGFAIVDISNTLSPDYMNYVDGSDLSRAGAYWSHSDLDFLMNYISAAPGKHNMVAVGSLSYGLWIFDTSSKNIDGFHYQDAGDGGNYVSWVHAANINGRSYVFAVGSTGLLLYDMTAASSLHSCVENSKVGSFRCPGVYKGLMARNGIGFIHGTGNLLVLRSGTKDIEIYRVDNPTTFAVSSPRLTGSLPDNGSGVVIWEYDYDRNGQDEVYLGALTRKLGAGNKQMSYLQIYDVSCVNSSGSCTLGSPQATYDVTDWMRKSASQSNLSLSVDNGTPYLYVGNDSAGNPYLTSDSCQPQREFLLDMSRYNPNSPPALPTLDLTPSSIFNNGGYWGWYYQACHVLTNGVLSPDPPGFNDIVPRFGVVTKGYFYRAAYRIADSHKIAAAAVLPPTAEFSWTPSTVYAGVPVTFIDESTGNPAADTWNWTFSGGTPPSSFFENPVVTFATPGNKNVGLTSFNENGASDLVGKTVQVLDPMPKVDAVTTDKPSTPVCGTIDLDAVNVTGAPTRTVSWDFRFAIDIFSDGFETGTTAMWSSASGDVTPALRRPAVKLAPKPRILSKGFDPCGNVEHCSWQVPADQKPTIYLATVTVTNSFGQAEATSSWFNVEPLPMVVTKMPTWDEPLDPADGSLVRFHVEDSGASEIRWYWNVGGGDIDDADSGWLPNDAANRNPEYTYSFAGDKVVKIEFRQCQDDSTISAWQTTVTGVPEPLSPDILDITAFSPQCPGGPCVFGVVQGTPIGFAYVYGADSVTPTTWDYDWDGDGTYEDTGNTSPVTSKIFDAGCHQPWVQVNYQALSDSIQASEQFCVQ